MTTSAAHPKRYRSFFGSYHGRRPVFFLAGPFAACALLAACAAANEDDADGPPDFNGFAPSNSGTQVPAAGTPNAPGATAGTPSTPSPTTNTGGGEVNPAGGAPIAPPAQPPGSNDTNTSSPNNGSGGSSMVPPSSGNVGTGGSSTGPAEPPSDQPPPEPDPEPEPTTPVIDTDCPAGAIFCSGFEQADFPVGTANIFGGTQFADGFRLDTTVFHEGRQSFFLPLTSQAFSYRVMAIPVSVQAFWARTFVRFDTLFGDVDHDGILAISSGDLTTDNNRETRIELSEQEGTIVLNRSTDQITFPANRPQTLAANAWHCVEVRFDGNAGDVEVFANGQTVISARGSAQFQFQVQTFRIGTLQFHAPRNVWFDDVVLATDRVGCN